MQFPALLVKVISYPCSGLISDTFHPIGLFLRCRVTYLLEPVRVCANDTGSIELIRQPDRLCKCRLERSYLQAGKESDQIAQIAIIRRI